MAVKTKAARQASERSQGELLEEEVEALLRRKIGSPRWRRLELKNTTGPLLEWAADLVAGRAGINGRTRVAVAGKREFRRTAREAAGRILTDTQIDRGINQMTARRTRSVVITHHAY